MPTRRKYDETNNEDIVLENDIPAPVGPMRGTRGPSAWNRYRRAAESMDVGQSFTAPRDDRQRAASACKMAKDRAKKEEGLEKLYVTRMNYEDGSLRVWRTN